MMKKRLAAGSLALCMALSLVSCAKKEQSPAVQPVDGQNTASQTAQSGETVLSAEAVSAVQRPGFLSGSEELYDENLVPKVPAYEIADDFSNVVNADSFQYSGVQVFSKTVQNSLRNNGFAVVNSANHEFFELYESNRYSLTPNFVTVDSIMHTYHLYFSYLLRNTEKNFLSSQMAELSAAMLQASTQQLQELQGTEWENAAVRNAAFFAVGLELLRPGTADVPAQAKSIAEQELELIGAHAAIAESPLMNLGTAAQQMEDYTQYIPRGYYESSEELQRYFRAMMWYGRMNFTQSDEDMDRSALLIAMALQQQDRMNLWESVYNVTAFFAGASDDAGVYEYTPLMQKACGSDVSVQSLLSDPGAWQTYHALTGSAPAPQINSMPIDEDDALNPTITGFRFMGQRFTLDAAIFQNLVYRKVEEADGSARMLPDALDVPAALGSDRALEILHLKGNDKYPNYDSQMDKVRTAVQQAPDSVWNASLYGGWLHTLRPLLEEKGEGYPAFMQSDAWIRKDLTTFLGSWTELKHDTILYGKQVYAEMGGAGMEEQDDRGYVEPEPKVYARLAALSRATAQGLEKYGVISAADVENLQLLAQLSTRLMEISEKELSNETCSDDDYELIRTYGGQLEHFWYDALKDDAAQQGMEWFSSMEFPSALIVDVATDPNGEVLEVATGAPAEIYVIVPVDGTLRLASGTVFTFTEFSQPLSERMTDSQWRYQLGLTAGDDGWFSQERTEPEIPFWASDYQFSGTNAYDR